MNVKKELLFGVLSIILISVLILVFSAGYKKQSSLSTVLENTSSSKKTYAVGLALSSDEVNKHAVSSDCWLIIENKVYQATDYLSKHPGGADRIIPYCGTDATQPFLTQGGKGKHSQTALQELGMLYLGDLNGTVIQQPDQKAIESLPVGREDEDDDD